MNPASLPRILLVEDDPVSRAFLAAAAEGLPARVDQAATVAEARALAGGHAHDLWLIDANLPDGRGTHLLRELRARADTPALAHTAATTRAELDVLVEAGFAEVLVKPLTAAQLQHAIRRMLAGGRPSTVPAAVAGCGKLPVWDEEAALAAVNGQRQHALQLRTLFLSDLPGQGDAVRHAFAAGDLAALQARLHRLQGGCGFVAAARLGAAIHALRESPRSHEAMLAFEHAAADTLASASGASG